MMLLHSQVGTSRVLHDCARGAYTSARLGKLCLAGILVASLTLSVAIPASAANDPCGIGGTGWLDGLPSLMPLGEGTGIGGTGRAEGIGGKGHSSDGEASNVGIGGTGRSADREASNVGVGGTGAGDDGLPADIGIGGTGRSDDAEASTAGIGGTGRADGIGGTGRDAIVPGGEGNGIGGTGFVGTVTAFGSICVNGARITYDDSTPVRIDGRAATVADLAVGQVVVVEAGRVASDSGPDNWTASVVEVQHIIAGPVARFDAATGRIDILGQRVQLVRESRTAPHVFDDNGTLVPGMWLVVAGMRRDDGVIVASLLGEGGQGGVSDGETLLRGQISKDSDGGLLVAGVSIRSDFDSQLASGAEVLVRGVLNGGASSVIDAQSIELSGISTLQGRVATVALEGFVDASSGRDNLAVGSMNVRDASGGKRSVDVDRSLLVSGERVRVFGRFADDGSINLDAVSRAPRLATRATITGLGLAPPVRPKKTDSGGSAERGAGNDGSREKKSQGNQEGADRGDHDRADRDRADHDGGDSRPDARPGGGGREQANRPDRPERPQRPDRPERP
ncbi:MAG: hypothetical protein ACI91F_002941, partial [Candidatus Binatia bacterium]